MNIQNTDGAASFRFAQSSPVMPPQPSAFAKIMNELEISIKDVSALRAQANAIANSVFGVVPEGASKTARGGIGTNSPPPRMEATRYALNDLRSQIAGLRNEIERLSCI